MAFGWLSGQKNSSKEPEEYLFQSVPSWINGRTAGWMDGSRINGWMDGWMDRWMDGSRLNGWMDG